ncbi:MAG: hypothetical protein AAF902_16455, partial [Chloroflexota bacterium]
KVLDKLDSDTLQEFRIYLNSDLKEAMRLVNLRKHLNQLLNDISPGRVFLIQSGGSYLELATDQNVAPGIIAYESYFEAAADAGKSGEVQEFELDAARELASSQNMVLWVATADGETVQA